VNALVQLPIARLARTPRAWIPVGVWAFFAVAAALVLHGADPSSSASDALESAFGAIALPLLAYAVVGATLGGSGLARGVRPLVAFGASPARAALGQIVVAAVATALLGSFVGVVVAVLSHGSSDPPLARDVTATAWIGALGGAAYAALFAFGASFGRRGGGRAWLLVLDWGFGASDGTSGILTPRAHVRSLLGGDAVASLSNGASVALLVLLALGFGGLAVVRSRRF
jgi:hypothetical protein